MESLSGKLLVAAADLQDPNFARTVALLVDHDDEGAYGLVLNRAGSMTVKDAWEEYVKQPCTIAGPLLIGGPVAGPLAALHTDPALSEREVVPGVHFARRGDLLSALVAGEAGPLKVFAGYSGWGPGQLEKEIEGGSWGVTTATAEFAFGDESTLWHRVSRQIADERLIGWLRVRQVPRRPGDN